MTTVDRDISHIYMPCLRYYQTNRNSRSPSNITAIFDHLEDAVRKYLLSIASLFQETYEGWKADEAYPGYLTKIASPTVCRVPYHLVPAFPTDDALDAIFQVSQSIQTLRDSTICLSGSGALIKSAVVIGDLDFCEYMLADCSAVSRSIISKLNGGGNYVLRRLKFNGISWDNEFSGTNIQEEFSLIDPTDASRSHGKADFLVRSNSFRPIEASNVLIFCDSAWNSQAKTNTFAQQEAILSPVEIIPNTIANPFEIGRYLNWLMEQMAQYIDQENHIKALKRSLSISRFCHFPKISDKITEFSSRSQEIMQAEIKEIDKISKMINEIDYIEVEQWQKELEWWREKAIHEKKGNPQSENGTSLALFSIQIATELKKNLNWVEAC